MFLVMVVHADFRALGVPSHDEIVDFPISSFMRFFIESISIVCVNLFILISGWFGIRFKLLRLGGLVFQVFFVVLLMWIVLVFRGDVYSLNIKDYILFFSERYWFVKAYIVLYLFAPALNYFVENESPKIVKIFLVFFFLFQTIFGFIISLSWFSQGYSPLSFMGLYVLGRYMRNYPNNYTKQKRSVDILVYLSMVLLTTCLAYLFSVSRMDIFKAYAYSSPFVIVGSVSLFLFFTKFSFKNSIINWIAVSCLLIYLVHCFPVFFERVYLFQIKDWFDSLNTLSFLLCSFLWIVLFLVISVILDKFRVYLWNKFLCYFRLIGLD